MPHINTWQFCSQFHGRKHMTSSRLVEVPVMAKGMQQLVYVSVAWHECVITPAPHATPHDYSFSRSHHHTASTNTQTSQGTKCSTLWAFGGNFIFVTAAYSSSCVVPQLPILGPEKHQHVFPGLYSFCGEVWCHYDLLSFTCIWHFSFAVLKCPVKRLLTGHVCLGF